MRLRTRIVDDVGDLARIAADLVLATPGLRVLGVATGDSPLPVYSALAERRSELTAVSAYALDEYVGLPPGHRASYHHVVHRTVTEPLRLDPARVHIPDGNAADLEGAAAEFEESIHAGGGIDCQILGIGGNGHIGFNEPGSSVASRTRVVRLAEATRAANARYFESSGEVPTHAVTQGIDTILRARRIVLIARGASKAHAIARLLEAPATTEFPASALHAHPDVTVVLDSDASSIIRGERTELLSRRDAWPGGTGVPAGRS